MTTSRVAVNGYGVVGKRVGDAVRAMPDMEVVGVADVPVAGRLEGLLGLVNVVVDTTPKKVAAANLDRYRTAGIKAVLQGGEAHATTGHSFVAQAHYATALGRDATRAVSCNTTSIVRVLGALHNAGLLARSRGGAAGRPADRVLPYGGRPGRAEHDRRADARPGAAPR